MNVAVMQHETQPVSRQPPTLTIRSAAEADAASLQRFIANLIAERLPTLFRRERAPTVEDEVSFIRQVAQTPRSVLLLAIAGDEIAGMLDFHSHQTHQRSQSGEFGMSVAKSWRGRGVGSQLLTHLFGWASAQRLRRIELNVFSNNTGAMSLYERLGFVREGAQREAVEVEGHYVDIVLMAKSLPDPAAVLRRPHAKGEKCIY